MIKPLSLLIGLRYTRAKRRNRFVSFISIASVIGIALGVMVLITVLSVMNGFNQVVTTKFFSIAPQINVMTNDPLDQARKRLDQVLIHIPQVIGIAPYVSGQGMLSDGPEVSAVQVMGIDPKQEGAVSGIASKVTEGRLNSLTPGSFYAVIGVELAGTLGAYLDSEITLYTTETTITPLGLLPRFRRLHVSGLFETKSGFGYDEGLIYVNIQDAEKLFPTKKIGRSGFHLKLKDMYQAPAVTQNLIEQLPNSYLVTNWTSNYGSLFKALAMQKTIMFLVLLLIILIAAFNLIVSLVMGVNEKRADIAILRTLGAKRSTVMAVFIFQGAIVGLAGTIVGIICGIGLSLSITNLVNWIQHTFGVQWVSAQAFWVDYLPSSLHGGDVCTVGLIAFVLSLLATLYPASLAFRTQPAEALRYE
jgi:lipoprotein-releasing system permease protein